MTFLKKRIGDGENGFGATLRELRELRGYSLEGLGRRSGIHPLLIAALEEERLEALADPLYAERHVIALSDILETRATYLLEKYRALLKRRGVAQARAPFSRARVRASELFVHSRAVAFGIFLCVIGLISAYIFWQASILSSKPSLSVDSPREGAVYAQPSVRVVGVTNPGTFVRVNGFSAVVDPKGSFSMSLDVPRGVSTVRVEVHRRYGPSVVIERHVTYNLPPREQSQ